jgi:hypothetical protein
MSKRKPQTMQLYSIVDELMASPVNPLHKNQRDHHLGIIAKSFHALEKGEHPTLQDVGHVADAVNMLDTIVNMRFNQTAKDFDEIEFPDETRRASTDAVARCAIRGRETGTYRFDAPGLVVVRELIEFYSDLLDVLPARVFIKAHRKTTTDVADALAGRLKSKDIQVVEV